MLNDCKKNPAKWEPVGRVSMMREWNNQEGFLRYLDETIRLAQGTLKESSFDYLQFGYDEGVVEMLWAIINDLHEMGHYFARIGICIDNLTFGRAIYEAVDNYE